MVQRWKSVTGVSVINLIIGLLVLAGPFLIPVNTAMFWTHVIVGLLIVVLSGYNASQAYKGRPDKVYGTAIVNLILGLGVIAAPWILGWLVEVHLTINGLLGILLVILAGYNTYAASAERREMEAGAPQIQ